jgi:hypothetical protein
MVGIGAALFKENNPITVSNQAAAEEEDVHA